MSVALLVPRVVVGALFAGHDSQKLFGWFQRPRLERDRRLLSRAPGRPRASSSPSSRAAADLGGGLVLGFGVACLLLVAVIATAIRDSAQEERRLRVRRRLRVPACARGGPDRATDPSAHGSPIPLRSPRPRSGVGPTRPPSTSGLELRRARPIGPSRKRSLGGVTRRAIGGQVRTVHCRGRSSSERSPPASEIGTLEAGVP
jgi:hypothetical protein